MNEQLKTCPFCGAPVQAGLSHCEACGQSLTSQGSPMDYVNQQGPEPAPTPAPTPTPPPLHHPAEQGAQPAVPAPAPPPPGTTTPLPAPARKGGFPIWLIVVLVLVVVCLCAAIIVGVVTISRMTSTVSSQSAVDEIIERVPALGEVVSSSTQESSGTPTQRPIPTREPTPIPTIVTAREQTRDENLLFDDFSSNQFGWLEDQDEVSIQGLEGERYFIHVLEPEWIVWSYAPVDFFPSQAEFSAQVPGDVSGGTFGVLCHMTDSDNYYFVEIDLADKTYSFGKSDVSGMSTVLPEGWFAALHLKEDAHASNTVKVICEADSITLYINDELEKQADLEEQAPQGQLAIFAFSWDTLGADGYKVYFDEFEARR